VNPVAITPDVERRISGVAALDQPLRRDLYRLLAERDGWVSRDEAAERLGVPRSVAAFHLDKLAEAGVVDVQFQRIGGRRGPGAGRPSKLYRRRDEDVAASVPPRSYDLAGSLLLEAVAEAATTGEPVPDCLAHTAHERGRHVGEEAVGSEPRQALTTLLERNGYAPSASTGEEITLGNCPFHRLAEQNRDLVCGMNLDFLQGVVDGLGASDRLAARLAPEPGLCCVRFTTV
jgi:predicted ArsR family transcriptional regulator